MFTREGLHDHRDVASTSANWGARSITWTKRPGRHDHSFLPAHTSREMRALGGSDRLARF